MKSTDSKLHETKQNKFVTLLTEPTRIYCNEQPLQVKHQIYLIFVWEHDLK